MFSGFGRKQDMMTYANLNTALKTTGFLDAILMIISSQTMDEKDLDPLLAVMDSLVQQYGANILDHIALVFTRWKYNDKKTTKPNKLGKIFSCKITLLS